MEIKDALFHAFDGNSILFLGAGFSTSATNIRNNKLKTGTSFSKYLARIIGAPEDMALDRLSEYFIKKKGRRALLNELVSEFTVKKTSSSQQIIASINWKRVFTVNYDNSIIRAAAAKSIKIHKATLDNDPSNFINKKICLFINGDIEEITEDNIDTKFKLTSSSYAAEHLNKSPWGSVFRRDLRTCSSVFFIGYSLYDLDIRRVLYETEFLKNKCYFVLGKDPDEFTVMDVSPYGNLLNEDVDSFSKVILEHKKCYIPPDASFAVYDSFDKVETKDCAHSISASDIFDLFLYGNVKYKCIMYSLSEGNNSYYVNRKEVKSIVDSFDAGYGDIIIHSNLGNGKSLLVAGVAFLALSRGYSVYILRQDGVLSEKETEEIFSNSESKIVIIENYPMLIHKMGEFQSFRSEKTKILYTSRTMRNEVVSSQLQSVIEGDVLEYDINKLDKNDINVCYELMESYGLWGDYSSMSKREKFKKLLDGCKGEMSSILLLIMNSPDIAKRISKLVKELEKDKETLEAVMAIFVLNYLEVQVNLDVLIDLVGIDVVRSINFKNNPAVSEFISFDGNYVKTKSSVVSYHILKNFKNGKLLIEVLLEIARRSDLHYSSNFMYRNIFRELMRFGTIQSVLPARQKREFILYYYDSLKRIGKCTGNHFYWLQYAIACITIDDFDRAKKYFENAYSLSKKRPYFDTYQIDNHYARFLLISSHYFYPDAGYMDNFNRAKNIINQQMNKEELEYPYKVAQHYGDFYHAYSEKLNVNDLKAIKEACEYVLSKIASLPQQKQSKFDVVICKRIMNEVVDLVNNRTTQ